jgi:hypothetical protein
MRTLLTNTSSDRSAQQGPHIENELLVFSSTRSSTWCGHPISVIWPDRCDDLSPSYNLLAYLP